MTAIINPKGTRLGNEPPAALAINVPEWMSEALCAQVGHGDDWWFPDKGASPRTAKEVCASCPVKAECLQFALDNEEQFGIFGGLSVQERRKLKAGKPVHQPTGICQVCGDEYVRSQWNQRYCSPTCGGRHERAQRRIRAAA